MKLGVDILAICLDGFPSHNLATYGYLNGNFELLSWNGFFEFFRYFFALVISLFFDSNNTHRCKELVIEEYIQLDQFGFLPASQLVVHRAKPLRNTLQTIMKGGNNLDERKEI